MRHRSRLTARARLRPPGGLPLLLIPVGAIVAFLITWNTGPAMPSTPALVVGDSVIVQSAAALTDFAPPGLAVSVRAALGTAPCDWEKGFVDPFTHKYESYTQDLRLLRPRYVVIMFTGNPGLSGPSAGCVDANQPYSLAELLRSYRDAITTMAEQASAIHATVYLERPPPRNPATPSGYDAATRANRGYQGVTPVAQMLQSIAALTPPGDRWIYEDGGAGAISGPGFAYQAWIPCSFLEQQRCVDGVVLVRASNNDAIHLDPAGCGAIPFSLGIEDQLPGSHQHQDEQLLQSDRRTYKACT